MVSAMQSAKCPSVMETGCRYADLLQNKMEVVLLTNDANCRYRAESEMGLKAMSVVKYAEGRKDCQELYDIAQTWAQEDAVDAGI